MDAILSVVMMLLGLTFGPPGGPELQADSPTRFRKDLSGWECRLTESVDTFQQQARLLQQST